MLNKHPQHIWKIGLVFLLLITIPFGFFLLNKADADNLLANGSFISDLSEWTNVGDLQASWDPLGDLTSIINNGVSYPGVGGALAFTTANENLPVTGYVYQDVNIPAANQVIQLSFAYKKAQDDGGNPQVKQNISISIVGPTGGSPQVIWENTLPEPDSSWQKVYLDISQYFNTPGTYRVQLSAELQKGAASEVKVNFDQVIISMSAPDTTPPGPPSGVMVEDATTGGQVMVSWQPNPEPDFAGYQVYSSLDPAGPFNLISGDQLVVINQYYDQNLTNDTTYYYQVTAVDEIGNVSQPAITASGVPTLDTVPPGAPTGLVVFDRGLGSRLEISWSANPERDVVGYYVYRATDSNGSFEPIVNNLVTDTKISDQGLQDGTTYHYRLTARDKAGNESQLSPAVSGIPTKDTTPPAVPTNLMVANAGSGTSLLLSWLPNTESDIQGYNLYRGLTANGTFIKINSDPVGISGFYTDQGLERNVTYWYKIAAVDWANNESVQTMEAGGTTLDILPPAIPSGVKVVDLGNGSDLLVTWQPSPDQDLIGYNIYRSIGGAVFEKLNTSPITTATYTDSGLAKGVRYSYKLSALDEANNESAFSAVVSQTPKTAISIDVYNQGNLIPSAIKIWLDSPALFLNNSQDKIIVRATALGADGKGVPVSGKWKLYSGNDYFADVEQISPNTVQAFYRSDDIGDQDIMIEFIPNAGNAISTVETIRVFDWKVQLTAQSTKVRAGSRDAVLDAKVTEQDGQEVSDPHVQVLFNSFADRKVNSQPDQVTRIGRYRDDGRVEVDENTRGQGLAGKLDNLGYTKATLTASTVPTKNRIKVVVVYIDNSKPWYQPKIIAESDEVIIDVVPGPVSYVGWDNNILVLQADQEQTATLYAFDQFGNATSDYGNLKISVQNPVDGFLNYSLNGGETWITDKEWHNVLLGTAVKIKTDPAKVVLANKQGYIMVRIDQGPEMVLPPGINQVNQPLYISWK
ncbi:MAG: fibronectin type III domain-containing protein [Carboxydocellales bacterium]